VRFTNTNQSDLTGIYPALRDEVKSGRVKVRIDLDGDLINIPVREMTFPWAVSLEKSSVDEMSPQDLFYGIDRGARDNVLRGHDPLVPLK
jgi:hypothetical protein